MKNHRKAIMAGLLAVGLAASAGSLAEPAAVASSLHRTAIHRPVHAVYRRSYMGPIGSIDADRALRPQPAATPDGPAFGLATGTARYDLGPSGLHDEAPTVGLAMKF